MKENAMSMVRVTGNYQVTIPALIRKALQVNIGDFMSVTLDAANGVLIKPIEVRERQTEAEAWEQAGSKAMLSQYNDKDAAYDTMQL